MPKSLFSIANPANLLSKRDKQNFDEDLRSSHLNSFQSRAGKNLLVCNSMSAVLRLCWDFSGDKPFPLCLSCPWIRFRSCSSIRGKYPAFGAIDAFGTAEVVSGLGRKSLLPLGRALSLRVSSWGGLSWRWGFQEVGTSWVGVALGRALVRLICLWLF